jgi:hypothetical protein
MVTCHVETGTNFLPTSCVVLSAATICAHGLA